MEGGWGGRLPLIRVRVGGQPLHERAKPGSIGFAHAGGGVDEAALAVVVGLPDFLLEIKRPPALLLEPIGNVGVNSLFNQLPTVQLPLAQHQQQLTLRNSQPAEVW